ncbi:MAG TPA: hypothetical protein VIK81_04785 [Patescibacteria group bacterium]
MKLLVSRSENQNTTAFRPSVVYFSFFILAFFALPFSGLKIPFVNPESVFAQYNSYPSYPDYPGYPDYPSYPDYPPAYEGYGYPDYPDYDDYPFYDFYPEYPDYPDYPSYPSYATNTPTATPTSTPIPCTPLGAITANSPQSTIASSTPTFSWSLPSGSGPIQYRVEMTTNSAIPWTWYWYSPNITDVTSMAYPTNQWTLTAGAPVAPQTGLTSGTTYYWRVRADNGCNDGFGNTFVTSMDNPPGSSNASGGSGTPGNGDPQVFSYIANPAWLDTNNGNVGSQGPISELIAAPVGHNAKYLIISTNNVSNFTSENNTTIQNYDLNIPGAKSYDDFCRLVNCTAKPTVANNVIPAASGIYFHGAANDYIWGITSSPTVNGPVVIFIDGNLTINQNLDTQGTGAVMFIVKGNVSIHRDTRIVEALFVMDGTFYSCVNGPCNQTLTVTGGAIAHTGFSLTRDLGSASNTTTPAETFNYNPLYLTSFASLIGVPANTWVEVNP